MRALAACLLLCFTLPALAQDDAPSRVELRGRVEVKTWLTRAPTVWLVDGEARVRIKPRVASGALLHFEGRECVVSGHYLRERVFHAEELVSPARQELSGRIGVREAGPTLTTAAGREHALFGKLADLFPPSAGSTTRLVGWVFPDGATWVFQVDAHVTRDTDLRRYAWRVNQVQAGEAVTVVGRTYNGREYMLQPATGKKGFADPERIALGRPQPGLTGALGE